MSRTAAEDVARRVAIVFGLCRTAIPARFHRTFEDRSFDSCDLCQRLLLVDKVTYLVFKYYVGGQLRQELALCNSCRSTSKKGYSEQSKATLSKLYGNEHVSKRLAILYDAPDNADLAELMTNQCSLCGVHRSDTQEFFEYALCEGDEMIYYTHPSMVCAACTLRVYDSLSQETKDHKRRHHQTHYGLPPTGTEQTEISAARHGFWELL